MRSEYDRAQRDRYIHGKMGPYQGVNFAPRKTFFERPVEGFSREFDYADPRIYHDEGPRNYHAEVPRNYYADSINFGNERRNGPLLRREDPDYRRPIEDYHGSRMIEFREDRDFRRKGSYPHPHMRERSPVQKEIPSFRNSPSSRRESPHSRSGSSLSNRSYSPEKKKSYSYQAQQKKITLAVCLLFSTDKERPSSYSLNTSRDASPQSSTSASKISSDKSSKPPEPQPAEALSEKADETLEQSNDGSEAQPEFDDLQVFEGEQEEHQPSRDDTTKFLNDDFQERRAIAIAEKAREIEQVYRQDCKTFGMVVKMLVAKDPTLEKQLQTPLKENLIEIRERCLEDLQQFISQIDEEVLQQQ
ncbi:PPHLN protein, partial [Atractosteus spatula]|nr:PPHLN protein [Atractosteus spatula]